MGVLVSSIWSHVKYIKSGTRTCHALFIWRLKNIFKNKQENFYISCFSYEVLYTLTLDIFQSQQDHFRTEQAFILSGLRDTKNHENQLTLNKDFIKEVL